MANMMNMSGWKDKVGSFFKASPYQDIVDQATSEFLLTPAWEKNITIVDQINRGNNSEVTKNILVALRKRTSNPNPKVQFLSLTLMEMCLKNCGPHFRVALCEQKDLLQDVIKIATKEARKQGEHEPQLKALQLIYTWHHSFRTRIQYQALASMYSQAMAKGANFAGIEVPDDALLTDDSPAATRTRQSSGGGHNAASDNQRNRSMSSETPQTMGGGAAARTRPTQAQQPPAGNQCEAALDIEARALAALGISTEDGAETRAQAVEQLIEEASSCITLLVELIGANKGTPEALFADETCQQVYMQTKNVSTNIVNLLQSGAAMTTSEANFELLLQLNDTLTSTINEYESLVSNVREVMQQAMHGSPQRQPQGGGVQQQPQQQAQPTPAAAQQHPTGQRAVVIAPNQQPGHAIQPQPIRPAPTQQPQPQPTMKKRDSLDDLLGLDDIAITTAPTPQTQQTQPQAAPAPQGGADLMDTLFSAPTQTTTTTVASPPPQPAPVSQPEPQQQKKDDFDDFLNERAGVTGTTTQPPPAAQKPAEVDPMDDFLAERTGEPVKTTPAPAAPAPVDPMDDFLNERTGGTTTTTPAPATAPAPSSDPMDDFLNERAGETATTTPAAPTTAAPAPSSDPMDDFLNERTTAQAPTSQPASDPMDDFLNERTAAPAAPVPTKPEPSSDPMDDLLGLDSAPTPAAPTKAAPAPPKTSNTSLDDDFDAFLAERT
eukprot:TRINITY_DN66285_c5_g1_i2.p1 TRINITY_DN66285_c5_g1~~TRINITY_DN66285_c5_g1_i2.p1  ORF type:complete len:734 (+),score=154.87 TRINITY_DN66285_c5_g1_i2:46-2202(+)